MPNIVGASTELGGLAKNIHKQAMVDNFCKKEKEITVKMPP